MSNPDLARQRLINQHIAGPVSAGPGDVVQWLGAVQAQDYLGALWAVGLRMRRATEQEVEQAIADKTILRTWPMRGTLHFVAPQDARWMLKLLTRRVVAANARRLFQNYDLDDATFARSTEALVIALEGGRCLTRAGMCQALEAAHIPTANQRGLHILWRLAQDGLICFGPRQDKQHTFVLLEEWAPPARVLERDEALAELARRYFTSHGPATLQDFAWWSGLTVADAKAGLDMIRSDFAEVVVDGVSYWISRATPAARVPSSRAWLLPAFDEYMVGYTDRSAALDAVHQQYARRADILLGPVIVSAGRVVSAWKRKFEKAAVAIAPHPFTALTEAQDQALAAAAQRYGAFLGLPAVLERG